MKLNISKNYIIDRTFDKTLSQLDSIVSSSFYNSQYSTFGNLSSTDPFQFILMAKWATIGRPILAEITSTKICAKISKHDSKTKIETIAKSNPLIIFFFIFSAFVALLKLITYKTTEDLKLSGIYFLAAIGTLLLDRFIKNIVIASFETDMDLK